MEQGHRFPREDLLALDPIELAGRILAGEGSARLTADLTLGLLHKLNNVMTAVYFSADGCDAELEPTHPAREMLKALTESVREAQQLVKRTAEVNFSFGPAEVGYQDLNLLLKEDEDLVRIALPKNAHVEIVTAPVPLLVRTSVADFRRIILNFAINARDAMGEEPRVRVSAFPAEELNPGEYDPEIPAELLSGAAFALADNGHGVVQRAFPEIAEPFVSTRAGRLGMGLYHASIAARRNGGMIALRRNLEAGAQFVCILPRIAES